MINKLLAFGILFLMLVGCLACVPLEDLYFVNCSSKPARVTLSYCLPNDRRVLFSGTVLPHSVLKAEEVIPLHPAGQGVKGQQYRITVSQADGPAVEYHMYAEELAGQSNVFTICDCP